MATIKIIGRISKEGKAYYQYAENKDDTTTWCPVFVSKKLPDGKFEQISRERKVDKNGNVFEVIEINERNLYKPSEGKYIITK